MSRCGCESVSSCQCAISAGEGIAVSGSGSLADPWVVSIDLDSDADQAGSLSSAGLLIPGGGAREALGTVTVNQNGTRTSTTTRATYRKTGREVVGAIELTVTAAGSAGNDITLTVAGLPAPVGSGVVVGFFEYKQTGGAYHTGTVTVSGSTTLILHSDDGTDDLGTNPSFATANGDTLKIGLLYDAAS